MSSARPSAPMSRNPDRIDALFKFTSPQLLAARLGALEIGVLAGGKRHRGEENEEEGDDDDGTSAPYREGFPVLPRMLLHLHVRMVVASRLLESEDVEQESTQIADALQTLSDGVEKEWKTTLGSRPYAVFAEAAADMFGFEYVKDEKSLELVGEDGNESIEEALSRVVKKWFANLEEEFDQSAIDEIITIADELAKDIQTAIDMRMVNSPS